MLHPNMILNLKPARSCVLICCCVHSGSVKQLGLSIQILFRCSHSQKHNNLDGTVRKKTIEKEEKSTKRCDSAASQYGRKPTVSAERLANQPRVIIYRVDVQLFLFDEAK